MTIAFVAPFDSFSGLEIFSLRLGQDLAKRGHRIGYICLPGSKLQTEVMKLNQKSFFHQEITGLGFFNFQSRKIIAEVIADFKVDILISLKTRHLKSLFLLKNRGCSFRLVHLHQIGVGSHKRKDILHRLVFRQVDKVITICRHVMEDMLRLWPLSKDKLAMIYHGIDIKQFRFSEQTRKKLRAQYKIRPTDFVIAMIGRIDRLKGQVEVLEALSDLEIKNVKILFVGSVTPGFEDFEKELNAKIIQFGLASKVVRIPFRPDIEAVYSMADLVVLATTVRETFGLVALEAMACSRAVLVPHDSGIAEILEDSKEGFVFQNGNSADLRNKFNFILKNRKQAEKVAEAARILVTRKFKSEQMVDQYERLFQTLIEKK